MTANEVPGTRVTATSARPDDDDLLSAIRLWGAMVGIALQPISTAAGNIGFGIAIATALPRMPTMLPALRDLVRQRWLPWLIAWVLLTWCSLLWSPDPAFGREQFRASRVLLWIPLLWPLRDRWGHLVAAILTGSTAMVGIQTCQMAFGWPLGRWAPGSGLTTPTQTGLWAAVSLSFWLILVVAGSWRRAALALPIAVLTGVALVWSATRASVIGLMVELVIANLILALTSPGWLRRAAIRGLVGVAILAAAILFAPSALNSKARQAVSETTAAITGDRAETDQDRTAMWRMALDGWRREGGRAMLVGVGAGGIPSIAAKTTMRVAQGDLTRIRMIHSTYLQVLVETGCLGLLLLTTCVGLLLRDALRSVRHRPLHIASLGALIVWLVAAAFDGYQQSGGFLTVGAVLIPLALADLRDRARSA